MSSLSPDTISVLVTCEHAGNRVPGAYRHLFQRKEGLLESHRGFDRGAAEAASIIAAETGAHLFLHDVTRLLVDVNRSERSPSLFSAITRSLSHEERDSIRDNIYRPFRSKVESAVEDLLSRKHDLLHVSVHSFTPRLKGKRRRADIGLLYDPSRTRERELCLVAQKMLADRSDLVIRRNYPYLGKTDGMVTHLRKRYSVERYVGIELEVNQEYAMKGSRELKTVVSLVGNVFREMIGRGIL